MAVNIGKDPVQALGKGPKKPVIGFYGYDLALRDYLTLTVYPDPNSPDQAEAITVVPVTGPPRAEYATQDQIYDIRPDPSEHLKETITLPAMALSRLDFSFKKERWQKARFRKLGISEDGNRIFQSDYPMPFDVMYQLDIWAKYKVQLNQIIRQLALKFISREVWLKVDLGGPWGEKSIPIFWMEGPRDLTTFDHGVHGNIERKLRNVITFTMQAWILPDPTEIPTVRSTVYSYYLQETGDLPAPGDPIDLSVTTKIKEVRIDSSLGLDPTNENP